MKERKKKICVTVLTHEEHNASSGTAEILMRNCELLYENGYKVDLVTPRNDPLIEMLGKYLNSVSYIESAVGKKAVGKNLYKAYKIYKEMKPDLVHFHCPSYRWGLDAVLAARLAGIPYIIRTEQNPLMAMPELPVRILLRLANHQVSKFIYNCVGNRRRFEDLLPYRTSRGHVIVNCIDPNDFLVLEDDETTRESLRIEFGFPPESKVALFAAGFGLYDSDNRRPIYPVLQAFKKLLDDSDTQEIAGNWRLLVLGDPQPVGDDRVYGVVEEMGLSDYVHFAGHRLDFIRILNQCDLYTSAAHFEGSALTTFKGWALGVPILSTRVDGLSDVIGEEAFERLMVDHYDVEGYAKAWYEFMIEEPYRMEVHRKAGETVLAEYTIDKMKQRYMDVYNSLLEQK